MKCPFKMPEFPEVYTIVSDLNREIAGKRIISIQILDPALARPSKDIIKSLVGKNVEGVSQLGKNIVLNFQGGGGLIFHLRMTGRLLFRKRDAGADPYTRLVFYFGENQLRFCEMRRFGYAQYLSKDEMEVLKSHREINMLNISGEEFTKRIKEKNTIVKRALLDQDMISGVGNIYANEALFLAKINPERLTKSLLPREINLLLASLKTVINEGISHRGATLPDKSFVDIYGKPGSEQNYFKVYGKNGKPCPICNSIIVVKQISQRGSFFCPTCQKNTAWNP